MIIVMPYIFAVAQGTPEHANNPALFGRGLFQDVIPYVKKNYRALTGPANRAFGGLSVPNILPDVAFPDSVRRSDSGRGVRDEPRGVGLRR